MTDQDFISRGWTVEMEFPLETKVYKQSFPAKEINYYAEALYNPINKSLKLTAFWELWDGIPKKRELFLGKCPDAESFDYLCNLIF